MPLRDHFRPPLDDLRHWEGFHATWPVMIVADLRRHLPSPYFAEPRVHSGASAEIDVATFAQDVSGPSASGNGQSNGAGVGLALWAPPRPTLTVMTELPSQDTYEVLVYDEKRRSRLVAAIEIISPANKDRPESRRAFVAKCAGLLRERVSVVMIDVVTTRTANLYAELLEFLGHAAAAADEPPLYADACRLTRRDPDWLLETWTRPLQVGAALPIVPLWLADDLALPLDLNDSYEQSCDVLGIS